MCTFTIRCMYPFVLCSALLISQMLRKCLTRHVYKYLYVLSIFLEISDLGCLDSVNVKTLWFTPNTSRSAST